MNITFLIGNGFDLRLGMKTRFTDMYIEYLETESPSLVIENFKTMIKLDAPNGYPTWSDFEMAMGKAISNFGSEDDFVSCIRDFKSFMVTYLLKEEKKFLENIPSWDTKTLLVKELQLSMTTFYKGQTPNVQNIIDKMKDDVFDDFSFITFNYTRVLDEIIKDYVSYTKRPINNLIHIHGKLDADVVLGINDETQLGKHKFNFTKKLLRAFVKPYFNFAFDEQRVVDANEIITKSDVICIYGMSLGDSDEIWVENIYNWLLQNSNHHLICYKYSERRFNRLNQDEIMDEEDERIEKIITRICKGRERKDEFYNQIHVPVEFDIFDFKRIIEDESKRVVQVIENRLTVGTHN